jgi:multidrug efflux system outer membrane protein
MMVPPRVGIRRGSSGRRFATARSLALLLVPAILAGCAAVGKEYKPPSPPVPRTWSGTRIATGVTPDEPLEIARWWTVFDDPILDSLMMKAASANLDLRVAESRLRESRFAGNIVSAGSRPSVDAMARQVRGRDNLSPAPPEGATGNLFRMGFDAAWEIDLFGGNRRAVEASDADVGAALENRRAVLVSLLGEVATNYTELRGLQGQIVLLRDTLLAQRETLSVVRARQAAGLTSEFDVDRAEAQLAVFEAQLPALEAPRDRAVHRLGVLTGSEPGAFSDILLPGGPIPVPPPQVRIGLPSDLLLRRPDLRRAERELAAATARAGAARADLYPRISLAGFLGLQSFTLGDLADGSSRIWSGGGGISWPIFDAGRIRANIHVQDERQERALVLYEKTLLFAMEDVENGIVAYGKEESRRRSLAAAAEANARSLETANALYRAGLAEYLQVLDAQRNLYDTQSRLTQSESAVTLDLVALYKALGGGWENDAPLRVDAARSGGR